MDERGCTTTTAGGRTMSESGECHGGAGGTPSWCVGSAVSRRREGGLVAGELSPVVVGVDGSDPARAATRWAADDAVRRGRPLRIVHSMGPWAYATPLYPAPVVMESLQEAGRAIL